MRDLTAVELREVKKAIAKSIDFLEQYEDMREKYADRHGRDLGFTPKPVIMRKLNALRRAHVKLEKK